MENQCNVSVLLLMYFWEAKNLGGYSAPYWWVFDTLKMRVVWSSLFDVISFWCTFSKWFCSTLTYLRWFIVFKNSYTNRYLFLSSLSAITVVFSWYAMKVSRKWSEEPCICSKLACLWKNPLLLFLFNVFKSWLLQ